jgi:hypothetical protein
LVSSLDFVPETQEIIVAEQALEADADFLSST